MYFFIQTRTIVRVKPQSIAKLNTFPGVQMCALLPLGARELLAGTVLVNIRGIQKTRKIYDVLNAAPRRL